MFSGPGTFRRTHPLLPAVAAVALLTACGGDPDPDPDPAPAAPASASTAPSSSAPQTAPSSSAPPTTSPSTNSPLTQDTKDAFQAAMDAHPGADLDKCTMSTSLDDAGCGAALTAAGKVAADTERRLRRKDPEHADLLYGAALDTADAVQSGMHRLRHPIPCYGLSDEPQPPPPLRAEAEGICAEAADITKVEWRIFLTSVGTGIGP